MNPGYRLAIVGLVLMLSAALSTCSSRPGIETVGVTPSQQSCCSKSSSPSPDVVVSLQCDQPSQIVIPGEIAIFETSLRHTATHDVLFEVAVETLSGAVWKTALCFEDNCFMHDGHQRLVEELPLEAGRTEQIEIKMFVPAEAKLEDVKVVRMEVAAKGKPDVSIYLDLTGRVSQ